MPEINERWLPKKGKAGKSYAVRHPLRGRIELEVQPVRITQIYTADRAVQLAPESDESGTRSRTTVKVADLRRYWKKEA